MQNGRKKAVSLRLNVSDIRRIKRIAQRLGVRDSDVIRYALKNLLLKLSPLSDTAVRGRGLVPLFLEGGAELVHHFDLDAQRLSAIINEGAESEDTVCIEDLHLIAMTGGSFDAAAWRLSRTPQPEVREGRGDPADGEPRGHPMRRYLYDKYLYREPPDPAGD